MLAPSQAGAFQTAHPQGQSHPRPELRSCWHLLGCRCPLGPCSRPGPSHPGAASRATMSGPPARSISNRQCQMQHLKPLAAESSPNGKAALPVNCAASVPQGAFSQIRSNAGGCCSISCHWEQNPCTAAMLLFQCTPFLRQVGLSSHETESNRCLSNQLSFARPSCPCFEFPHTTFSAQINIAWPCNTKRAVSLVARFPDHCLLTGASLAASGAFLDTGVS